MLDIIFMNLKYAYDLLCIVTTQHTMSPTHMSTMNYHITHAATLKKSMHTVHVQHDSFLSLLAALAQACAAIVLKMTAVCAVASASLMTNVTGQHPNE